jgi:Flp pilus assembly protein TadG
MRIMRRRNGREQGQALVEFSLILPAFLLVFFGILESALMFNAWVSVQHAAELGARYAVTGRDSCSSGGGGRVGCITSEALVGMGHFADGDSATVSVRSWAFPSYSSVTEGSAGQQCDAVEVKVSYTYRSQMPMVSLIFKSKTLSGSQRFVNEPFGRCTG